MFARLSVFALFFHLVEPACELPIWYPTRYFDSLVHYQGNKISFTPGAPGWAGSTVEFTCSSIATLPTNAFITKDSSSIIVLKLTGKKVEEVDGGAFNSLTCLHQLFLNQNNIATISKDTFRDLRSLQVLDLSNNQLTTLQDHTFTNLPGLEILKLSNNKLRTLQDQTFANLTYLQDLDLSFNRLSVLQWSLFVPLNALTNLNLASNIFASFDPDYKFTFSSLETLNLSSNSLTKLNARALRARFPHLGYLDLKGNPWSCGDLNLMLHELRDAKIELAGADDLACAAPSSSTEKYIDKDFLEGYVEKKVRGLKASIRKLESLVIFSFVLFGVAVAALVAVRTKLCQRFRRDGGGYLDSSDVENITLLNR